MTVLIGTWEFEGPFSKNYELRHEAAIYAVLSCEKEEYELVELNESENIQKTFSRLKDVTPDDRDISVAVYYCSDLTDHLREGLVDVILQEFDISQDFEQANSCGERFDSQTFLAAANL